jgi:hypothetical protein
MTLCAPSLGIFPFDLPGPQFLGVYVAALIVAVIVVAIYRSRLGTAVDEP